MKDGDVQCFARRAFIHNGRRIDVRFARVDGRLVCVGLEIGPNLNDEGMFTDVKEGDLRPLTAAEMRFPFRRLVDDAIAYGFMTRSPAALGLEPAEAISAFAEDLDTLQRFQAEHRPGPGRPRRYGREHYEQVAELYRQHLAAGGRAPTKAVADEFTVTKSAAAKWVAKARELGMLEPA